MDQNWVTTLYNNYAEKLLRYIKSHTRNLEDAEDILQETFYSVAKHADSFDPSRCVEEAWLYIIAKRKLITYYRDKKDAKSIDDMEDFELLGISVQEEASELMERREHIANALSVLDERSREVIILRYFLDLEDEEIAEKLNISSTNVRVIRSRAMTKMRKYNYD